jgi:heme-degrading monooxygenase HmoA
MCSSKSIYPKFRGICILALFIHVGCQPTYQSDSATQSPKGNQQTDKNMIAVIFEVLPAEGHKQEYLDIAKDLRPKLDSIDGFISIERFESLNTPGKILSLSFWENEKALEQWRNLEAHRVAQKQGREIVFKDYRLRVASVIRDYGMFDRKEVPTDSKKFHSNR